MSAPLAWVSKNGFFNPHIELIYHLDSTRKCNRVMLKEYLKRRPKIKAFPWAQV
jgi:hypothetical protein